MMMAYKHLKVFIVYSGIFTFYLFAIQLAMALDKAAASNGIVLSGVIEETLTNTVDNTRTETACLGSTCFEKTPDNLKEKALTARYMALVERVNIDPTPHLYIGKELAANSKNPYQSFTRYFGWIKKDSLVYIIPGDAYSAVLLRKSVDDRYVLYFNHEVDRFELSYTTPVRYRVVDDLWVNGRTSLDITP